MFKQNIIIIFLLVTIPIINAQNFKGIHQIDQEKNEPQIIEKMKNFQKKNFSESIVPINKKATKSLSKSVFGYLPDWEYLENAHQNFNYDLLSHIAVFDFPVSKTGAISEPPSWPWTDLMNSAHESGTKVIMVIVNFSANDIHEILTSSIAKWIFFSGVKSKIINYNLDGVNIDFEGLNTADRGTVINDFMKELTDTVHAISPDLEVSFAAPAVNWGGWNLTGLAQSCDYLFVMGYDFFGSWSTTTGPTAPLIGGSYNITNTINVQYQTVTSFYPEKIILGVPYYGPHWETSTSQEGSSTLNFVESKRYRDAKPLSENYGVKWSSTYKNSWFSFTSDSKNNQVWFDTDSSLSLKYDLAISKKLKGIGMWALGYDGSRDELWNLLDKKFSVTVNVEDNKLPKDFILGQNYPNPFNPTTTIEYIIPSILKSEVSNEVSDFSLNYVTLKIYDILGSEVETMVSEIGKPGNYKIQFDGSKLPSGVYYYQMKTGNFSQTKKMLLLK
ncbi:MAG: T9SS type A sorting domain-containing protein [Ignavibacteriae bacterium]|nr:T9SS type A sorting domain-containing protein [Ignavibacteriota bacterium]